MQFKDLFSAYSGDYSRFRPSYPEALFQFLKTQTKSHQCAWDCGTGNGQAAISLTPFFEKVFASDASEQQLQSATKHPKIEYIHATAENSKLPDQSVDLAVVAQAFHWFKPEAFFQEAKRVIKPKGVLAVWCYSHCQISPIVDRVVNYLYSDILGNYWESERKLVESGYKEIDFPFSKIKAPRFQISLDWSLEQLVGYLGTWSALHKFVTTNGYNPLEPLFPELQVAWGCEPTRPVTWNITMKANRL